MSIVAVKKYKDKIEIACDFQTTVGDMKEATNKTKMNSKIISHNDMVLGVVGMVRDNAYMNMYIKTHKPKGPTVDDVMEFVFEFNEWSKKKDTKFQIESSFILVYKGSVFFIEGSMLVREVPEFIAIGSGSKYATAVLHLNNTVTKAVDIAKELDIYCSGKTTLKTIKL